MKMISIRRLIPTIALSVTLPGAIAGPVTIFTDGFDRPGNNIVGNGWSEIEGIASDVAITSNTLRLRGQAAGNNGTAAAPDAAVTRTISTLGFSDVSVSFSWSPFAASEVSDFLNLAWKRSTDTTYTNVGSLALGTGGSGDFTLSSFNLGALANNTSIDLRFWTNVNVDDEGAFLDSVTVTAVPEPASLALLGIGLLGATLTRRRTKSDIK